ncbi:MAG: hypothetical protein ACR2OC_06495 [Solirubrobacterales bacterium]
MSWMRRGRHAVLVAAVVITTALGASASAGQERAETGNAAWVQRALELQYELGSDLGFRDAPWVGTHNSFNSTAEMGQTISANDSNQEITIREQLDQGIRSIELDLHYFPSVAGGRQTTVVCHARDSSEGNLGCTTEKTFDQVLIGIEAWLAENPDQVLMLYLEDDMDTPPGYEDAGATLDKRLGPMIYRPKPPADGCEELPLELSRDAIRAAGKQVFAVSDCGGAASWRGGVFTWDERLETGIKSFSEFPECGTDYTREQYDETLVRYFEDSTALGAATGDPGKIDETVAAQLARCGVDLIHFDQLQTDDPRLATVIWSWAPGEPGKGSCSTQRVGADVPFGRWKSRSCAGKRLAACRNGGGKWSLSAERVSFAQAKPACREGKARFAVPRTGYEAQLLRLAMQADGARGAWLGQRREAGEWLALDRR